VVALYFNIEIVKHKKIIMNMKKFNAIVNLKYHEWLNEK